MQNTATSRTPVLEVPQIDSDEPVAVVPIASVAPLDDRADGERINLFTLAPASEDAAPQSDPVLDAMARLRDKVVARPLAGVCAAFAMGFLIGRVLR
jgi:hypothetical protein